MEFCDHTEIKETKRGSNESSNTIERDYTSSEIFTEFNSYKQVFYKSQVNKNVIADFSGKTNSILIYGNFLKFKKDYISFLSFLNGATVKIRKEFTGNYLSLDKVTLKSEITVVYSFEKLTNKRHNNYIPLNKRLTNVPDNIIGKAFLFSFDKFREWNIKLDLSSIIYYLNTVEKINSAEERFFIQIIAFERLAKLYSKYAYPVNECLPSPEDFEIIKNEFYIILENNKEKFGSNFDKAKGLIGNLNKTKISNTAKLYGILNDVNIEINDDIRNLIEEVRNNTVHEGEIGDGTDGIKNMHLLNELIHEIILRLIEYRGIRYNKYILDPQNYIYE